MLFWNRYLVITGRSVVTAVCLLCLLGCWSPKQAIDTKAIEVGNLASSSALHFESIEQLASSSSARFEDSGNNEGLAEQQAIVSHALDGVDEQRTIVDSASGIRSDLHGVEDAVPWWAMLTGRALWVIGAIVVLIVLWKSGAFTFIRSVFWGIGLFIPAKAIREVQLDLKVMDESSPTTIRESVASKRASDSSYEAAYKKVKGR